MTKHTPATPLPWRIYKGGEFGSLDLNGDGDYSGKGYSSQDAAYLLHAANAYPRLVEDAQQRKAALTSLYLMCADKVFSKSPQVREFAAMMQRELDAEAQRTSALLRELGEE
jgi:hypothetical protein